MSRITGRDVEVRLGSGLVITFDEVNLNLDDGITATSDQGYPDGWGRGEITGGGDMKTNIADHNAILAEVPEGGSFEMLDAFSMTFFGSAGSEELLIEVDGAKIKFPSYSFDGAGGPKQMASFPFLVTGPDFVKINGTRLAKPRPDFSGA